MEPIGSDNFSLLVSFLLLVSASPAICRIIYNYDVGGGASDWNGIFSDSYEVCETPGCKAAARSLIKAMNTSVDPCSDFYEFACGGWASSHPIPATDSQWNHFNEAENRLRAQLRVILQSAPDETEPLPVQQAKQLYSACMDSDAIETENLQPLLEEMAPLGGWPMASDEWDESTFSWQDVVNRLRSRWAVAPLFVVYVFTDRRDTSKNTLNVDQPALTLPRRMLVEPSSYPVQHAALVTWIAGAAVELGRVSRQKLRPARVAEEARQVVDFEVELAKITTPPEGRRDAFRSYNARTVAELQAWTQAANPARKDSEIKWLEVLRSLLHGTGIQVDSAEHLVVRELDFIQRLVGLLDRTPRRTIANYLWWRLVRALSLDLTTHFRSLAFQFDQALIGTMEDQPRWRDCVERTTTLLSFAVGYKFVNSFFDDTAKQSAIAMVRNLRATFVADMKHVDWMDADTREAALDKASAMTEFIGYPDWYSNDTALAEFYRGVSVGDSHLHNIASVRAFLVRHSVQRLRKPVDRAEWLTGPAVVNAYYNPGTNSIIFPAGILQPPFYSRSRIEALNYGSIGVVIGHEITHGFDDIGRQSDAHGNLAQWWSASTLETYLRKARCMVRQYDAYRVPQLDGVLSPVATMNGVTTQGENIADNGGLNLAFKAYRRFVHRAGAEPRLPGLEEYSPEQLFFLGFANMWCESSTRESLLHEVLGDPHAPHRYRVLGSLANSKDFGEVWGCPLGGPMNPTDKCLVW